MAGKSVLSRGTEAEEVTTTGGWSQARHYGENVLPQETPRRGTGYPTPSTKLSRLGLGGSLVARWCVDWGVRACKEGDGVEEVEEVEEERG